MLDRTVATEVIETPMEGIQNAHQETRKAIDAKERDRTFRTYEESEDLNTGTILHTLKNILTRLDRIESFVRNKND